MQKQDISPTLYQGQDPNLPQELTPCPLLVRTGNCLLKSTCPYAHLSEFKKTEEGKKEFKPANPGKFGLGGGLSGLQKAAESLKISEGSGQFKAAVGAEASYGGGYQDQYQDQYYDDYYGQVPEGVYMSNSAQQYYMEEDEEVDYNEFIPGLMSCTCCSGYVNKCEGKVCKDLGVCYCKIDFDNREFH